MGNTYVSARRVERALDNHQHDHVLTSNTYNASDPDIARAMASSNTNYGHEPNGHAVDTTSRSHTAVADSIRHGIVSLDSSNSHPSRDANPSLVPFPYPSSTLAYPGQGHYNLHTSGHLVINITQPHHSFMMNHDVPPTPSLNPIASIPNISPLPHLVENPRANTIVNDVNVRKNTLHIHKDDENPGFHLVSFSFDALNDGWICILFYAKEGRGCSLIGMKPEVSEPVRIPFTKGLGQHFMQAPGTGVNLSLLEGLDEGPDGVFPLMIRTETMSKDHPLNISLRSRDNEPIDSPLPAWINAQMTHATLEKKEGNYVVKVAKQTIYVGGVRYELQEIYGIENVDGRVGMDEPGVGKECVICLSELRDTTVLPCRHMCMCSGCAKVLRFQSNRCPICRTPVERLLEIRVRKKDEKQDIDDCASSL